MCRRIDVVEFMIGESMNVRRRQCDAPPFNLNLVKGGVELSLSVGQVLTKSRDCAPGLCELEVMSDCLKILANQACRRDVDAL